MKISVTNRTKRRSVTLRGLWKFFTGDGDPAVGKLGWKDLIQGLKQSFGFPHKFFNTHTCIFRDRVCLCMCVCARDRERQGERKRNRETKKHALYTSGIRNFERWEIHYEKISTFQWFPQTIRLFLLKMRLYELHNKKVKEKILTADS